MPTRETQFQVVASVRTALTSFKFGSVSRLVSAATLSTVPASANECIYSGNGEEGWQGRWIRLFQRDDGDRQLVLHLLRDS